MRKKLIVAAVSVLVIGAAMSQAITFTMPSGTEVTLFDNYYGVEEGVQRYSLYATGYTSFRFWIDWGEPVFLDQVLQQNADIASTAAFAAYTVYAAADESGIDPTDWSEYDTTIASLTTPHGSSANEWRATSPFWRIRKRYMAVEVTALERGAITPTSWGNFGDWAAANLDSRTMSGGVVMDVFEGHNLLDYSSGTGPWYDVQKDLAATEVRLRLDMGAPVAAIQVGVSNIFVDTYQSVKVFEVYCASDEGDPGFDPTDWNDYDTLAATLPLDPQGYKADKFRLTPEFDVGDKRYLAIRITGNYRGAAWTTVANYSKANFADWVVNVTPDPPEPGTLIVVK